MNDPHFGLIECAKHGIPGPLLATNDCTCGLVHVTPITENEDDTELYPYQEAIDRLMRWSEDDTYPILVDVYANSDLLDH
jgi:hypothetical protein